MATLIEPASLPHDDAVELTDMEPRANKRTTSTLDMDGSDISDNNPSARHTTSQLKAADALFGPFQIGPVSVTRTALNTLGATLNGQPLDGQNTFFRTPKPAFINGLQFSAQRVEHYLKTFGSADDYLLPTLLFEIASRRPLTFAPMLRESPAAPAAAHGYSAKLQQLLGSAQKLDLRDAQLPPKTPRWVDRVKSGSMASVGVGLQAFGIFSGLRGLQDALRNKNAYETVFNGASIATEVGSIGVEVAVTRKATQMINAGQHAYKDFGKTRFAVRLGRAGGLIAGALTLPFDIISAVNAFNAAASASDKEAVDHYVSAGLSVTSAAMTVILGTAALAGFSFAGPVGIVAGLILIAGSQIWGAIRAVDEIDDYIELTALERLRTGWFTVWGISPDKYIVDRHAIAKASAEHSKMLLAAARKLLDGPLKDTTEVIVSGHVDVGLKQVPVRTYSWWTGSETIEIQDRPTTNDGDDTIDARNGVNPDTPGAVFGSAAEHKGVLWLIGGGNDTVAGVTKKPNEFHYASGLKDLVGGEKDDVFVFQGATDLLAEGQQDSRLSALNAGAGNDTLIFDGDLSTRTDKGWGYHVDLKAGKMSVIAKDSTSDNGKKKVDHALLSGFENVQTLAGGLNVVKATDGANIIKSRGDDAIDAGGGDDQVYLLNGNGWVTGGAGRDTFAVAHKQGHVSIVEDGVDESFIMLDWRMELIESWKIEQQDLIITSTFDLEDSGKRILRIEKVYKKINSQRHLKNSKLTFITKDGFYLVPELPDIIETPDATPVEATITRQGTLQYPAILYTPECSVPANIDTHYHVSRSTEHTTFKVEKFSKQAITTLHVDYASHELTRVESVYTAGETSSLRYDQILHFGGHRLTLHNLASAYSGSDLASRLARLTDNHHFILIMNDDVSYKVNREQIRANGLVNPANTGIERIWKIDVALPLKPRNGTLFYRLPRDNPPHSLGTWAKCVKIRVLAEHTAIENLLGQGSTYLIHLNPQTTLRISTPGALANAYLRLPRASTWEFDATSLGEVEIKLLNNQLHIGSNVIHLPVCEDPEDLIDQVRVITVNGVVHTVDLLFEAIYIDSLDARYFTPVPDPAKALPTALASLASLATKTLTVLNAQMADGTPGNLSYNFEQRSWLLDTDSSRLIELDEIRTNNRCAHERIAREQAVIDALNKVPIQ
ncbi:calcium-binding protein [Pseudomonas syringae]|nr:calcium-binding protein [Pseudomonas syringae]MCF5068132.1 calcium-binding protein [Pseudomonas syringae]